MKRSFAKRAFGLLLTCLLVTALPRAAAAATETFAYDPLHTQVFFTVDHMGFTTVRGRVNTFNGTFTLDQGQRVELYRQADRVLTEEAVVLPLFYGHIYELRQPWVRKPTGSSIYSPQWRDITLLPH